MDKDTKEMDGLTNAPQEQEREEQESRKGLTRRTILQGAGAVGAAYGAGALLSRVVRNKPLVEEAWAGEYGGGGSGSVTLFEINDSHGQCYPHPEMFWGPSPNDGSGSNINYISDIGGFDRIAGYIRHVKEQTGGNALFFDEGDTIHGTYHAIFDEAVSYVQMLNSIGLDATNPGNWETRWGPTKYIARTQEMNFPTLACNFYDKSTGKLIFPPYKIFNLPNGLRVGVIGLASDNINVQPKIFTDDGQTAVIVTTGLGRNELQRYVRRLKRGRVDLIVVISHLGYEKDCQIAGEYVPGIDVILSGHTHDRIFETGNLGGVGLTEISYDIKGHSGTTLVTQAGFSGSQLAELNLQIENGKVVSHDYHLLLVDSSMDVYKDPNVTAAMDTLNTTALSANPNLYDVVGTISKPVDRMTVQQDSMGNLICDAYLWAFGKDGLVTAAGNNILPFINGVQTAVNAVVAFTNGWRYGRPILAGDVNQEAVYNMNPANGPMFLVMITGAELYTIYENKLREANDTPILQGGGYPPRFKGMNVYARLNNYNGTRISQMFIDQADIEMDKVYPIINSGGQPIPVEYGTRYRLNKADGTPYLAVDVIKAFLEANPGWDASLTRDRLVLV